MGSVDLPESRKIAKAMKRKSEEAAAAEGRKEREEEEAEELRLREEAFEAEMEAEESDSVDAINTNDDEERNDPSFQHRGIDTALRPKTLNDLRLNIAALQTIRYSVSIEASAGNCSVIYSRSLL